MIKKINIGILTLALCAFSNANAQTNSSAGAGKALQIVGAAANATQGGIYTGECFSNIYKSCPLAVLSFVQAGVMVSAASQSGKTKSASDCTGIYCGDGNGSTIDPITGAPGGNLPGTGTLSPEDDILGRIQDDVNRNLDALKDKGYGYDSASNSLKTPNGNISANSLSTPGGLKSSLGLTDDDLRKMEEIGKKALADAKKKFGNGDFESFGGGGSKSSASPGYVDEQPFDMNKYLAGLRKKDANRGVAGLEKKYGNDQIGVAQDDIFKMINRRYQAKKTSLNP